MALFSRGRGRTQEPTIGVVVPAYQVADYLGACLDSLLAQRHRALDIVVVDDGSPDASGEIAEDYAAREQRIRVVHTDNHGLGAARNEGLRHLDTDYLAFADSDDVVPPAGYATLVASLERTGSDLVTGSVLRWETDGLHEPPWMRRLHSPQRQAITAAEHPEILGDVFAWNKLYRRSWWDAAGLAWPEGIRYEDQPATTRAFLESRFDVLAEPVYHWRIRDDGSSITQQRASVTDLVDRWQTKRMALAAVQASPQRAEVEPVFLDRVLAGDLHRYFVLIPGADDEWWSLLVAGVRELWGERSLVHSGLTPVHRLTGWLVEHGRRGQATQVMEYVATHPGPLPRVTVDGELRIDVPTLDLRDVDPTALRLRPHER